MEQAPDQPQITKIGEIKNNLQSWELFEWLVFFADIPLLLLLVYVLPPDIKDAFFIFHTSDPFSLPVSILSSYTHSELFPHLAANVALYYIAISAVFVFENNKQRFRLMAALSLLVVPVICSLLTIGLWHFFMAGTSLQGFSGIVAAFLAYAFMAGVTWSLSGRLELFDHPERFAGSRGRFYLLSFLLTFMLGMIVFEGILLGQFASTTGAVSNGIAHFGGFITGLSAFLFYDLLVEERKGFDIMLGVSILMGILVYLYYLIWIIKAVKGL